MKSKRITISLPTQLVGGLKKASEELGVSISEIIAKSLVRYLGLECPLCGARQE
jgi:metal-responsive CopG/Arc/MetJ family transcriptional regulator